MTLRQGHVLNKCSNAVNIILYMDRAVGLYTAGPEKDVKQLPTS